MSMLPTRRCGCPLVERFFCHAATPPLRQRKQEGYCVVPTWEFPTGAADGGWQALQEVMEALHEAGLAGRMEVYLDGGVRRGTDVVKALALGARAVGLGRPILHGLGVRGQQVRREMSQGVLCFAPNRGGQQVTP